MFANYYTDMNYKGRLFTTFILTIIFISNSTNCQAQEDHSLGNWNSLLLKGKISPKWSLLCEGHIRSSNFDLKYNYYEIKSAIGYSITKNLTGLFGTGFFNTDEPGGFFRTPALQQELRTWLELNLKQTFIRFNFEHRARLEQRFIGDNYKNRLKYRLGLLLPINNTEMIQGTLYLAISDELFMPQHGPVVEKNRFYLGMGYKMNQNTTLQLGCINDNDYKSNSHTAKNYLQLMLIYDFTKLVKKGG
ncbi:MAG: DUF2490 domain-containing protein [Mariniphaga sp.]|nr:DUF2490 domain-containing protein [Mariniphaga sp.]